MDDLKRDPEIEWALALVQTDLDILGTISDPTPEEEHAKGEAERMIAVLSRLAKEANYFIPEEHRQPSD